MRNVRVDGHIPFLTAVAMRGHATVHWFVPKIMDQWSVLTQRKKNLFPSIRNRGK
jgi:hypothetical protein